jgi:hypothetical protein
MGIMKTYEDGMRDGFSVAEAYADIVENSRHGMSVRFERAARILDTRITESRAALTAPPAAGEELPEPWKLEHDGAVFERGAHRIDVDVSLDGLSIEVAEEAGTGYGRQSTCISIPIAVVLAVIAKNRAGAGT